MSVTDGFDQKIIAALLKDARLPITKLAAHVGLSRTAVQQRINRLERDGDIAGYTIKQPKDTAKQEAGAYISIILIERVRSKAVIDMLREIPEILQCHQVSGETDLIVTVKSTNQERIQEICKSLWEHENVKETNTLFVLGSPIS